MSALEDREVQQREWARAHGVIASESGYVNSVDDHLFRPLSAAARDQFREASGQELAGKMLALHSSSALAANVFDFWMDRNRAPLQNALGIDSAIKDLQFERKCLTGLPGAPPNIDVVLRLADGSLLAIESKFCEWLAPATVEAAKAKPEFQASYFRGERRWAARGLPACQGLAEAMQAGTVRFQQLHAGQLLRHALGLAGAGSPFRLWYLYADWACAEQEAHDVDLKRFAQAVGVEIGFRAMTYQALAARLQRAGADQDYVRYLVDRYGERPAKAE